MDNFRLKRTTTTTTRDGQIYPKYSQYRYKPIGSSEPYRYRRFNSFSIWFMVSVTT